MKALFVTPIDRFRTFRQEYLKIRRHLLSSGHELTLDWVNYIEDHLARFSKFNHSNLFRKVSGSVKVSDITIIEGTIPSFETSSILNLSLKNKKPTLVLAQKEKKEIEPLDFIGVSENEYLEQHEYQQNEFKTIIDEFTKRNTGEAYSKFNIILERKQRNFLDWADRFYRKSKSELIREILDSYSEKDLSYQQFLKRSYE
jgi:hypothetical protein